MLRSYSYSGQEKLKGLYCKTQNFGIPPWNSEIQHYTVGQAEVALVPSLFQHPTLYRTIYIVLHMYIHYIMYHIHLLYVYT